MQNLTEPADRSHWWRCLDCGIDTQAIHEYYMVADEVWPLAEDAGMLCIGCLECRVGRQLRGVDFSDCPLNRRDGSPFVHSPRLRSRLEAV